MATDEHKVMRTLGMILFFATLGAAILAIVTQSLASGLAAVAFGILLALIKG